MQPALEAIFRKEGIHASSIEPLGGGQVNQVYRVNGEYVLRIGSREDAYERLKQETELLRSLAGAIPVPKIYAFGEEEGLVYQVQEYLPGEKLYLVWKDLPPTTQESIAAALAQVMQVLHSRALPTFGPVREPRQRYPSWPEYLVGEFERALGEYARLGIRVAPGFLELAREYFGRHQHVLAGGAPTLTHADLTLVNILVHQGRISAILDFEYAVYAPKDYELLAIESFCLYPNDWAEEEHEHFNAADFARLIPLLHKYYPALFAVPHLRERVNLYQIYNAVSSHLSWRKANLDTLPPDQMTAKEFYMARITNFTYSHGVRLFL